MPTRLIDFEFEFGDEVYLKSDYDQNERIVTKILLFPGGTIEYQLAYGATSSWHSPIEISKERRFEL